MKRIKTDVLVIGAGSGGLSVAAGAVQMGPMSLFWKVTRWAVIA